MVAKAKTPETLALDALGSLLADPAPRVLFGSKTVSGIFTSKTKATQDAARFCESAGWLERTETVVGKGRTAQNLYSFTPAGLAAALSKGDATELLKRVASNLAGFDKAVSSIPERVTELMADVARLQTTLSSMRLVVDKAAAELAPPDLSTLQAIIGQSPTSAATHVQASRKPTNGEQIETHLQDILRSWKGSGQRGDCPLPEIFQRLRDQHPSISVGEFHDVLRRLHQSRQVQLVHWALPLMEIPESDLALVAAHKVMYYASLP